MSLAYPPLVKPSPEKQIDSTSGSGRSPFTVKTFCVWVPKFAISLLDQALTSGVGFLSNLLLARWLRPESYGAFAVAFTSYLFVAGFHNVILLEPMSVIGPTRHAGDLPQYFKAQLTIHVLLTGVLSIAALLAGAAAEWLIPRAPLVGAMIGAGLALPMLLLLWLARRMCYVVQRPSIALAGSASYLIFVAAGLLALTRLGWLDSFATFLLMGFGSLVAAGILLWRLQIFHSSSRLHGSVSWRTVIRENWTYGRWLVGSTVLFSFSNQVQTFLAAGFVGLAGAGILRAMQLPALLMMQIVTAASLLVLPSFATGYDGRQFENLKIKSRATSLTLGGLGLVYLLLLFLFSKRLEYALFGGKFIGNESLMCLLALGSFFMALNVGPTLSIRAIQRPELDLLVSLVAAPVGLISGLLLIPKWGIWGAANSSVLTSAAILMGNFIFLKTVAARQSLRQGNS